MFPCHLQLTFVSTLRLRQNGHHFPDDIFKCIFLNENVWISIKVSLTFVPKGLINNIPALVQIMVWRRSGDKPLSEPVMVSLLMHICVTRPQWVNERWNIYMGNYHIGYIFHGIHCYQRIYQRYNLAKHHRHPCALLLCICNYISHHTILPYQYRNPFLQHMMY